MRLIFQKNFPTQKFKDVKEHGNLKDFHETSSAPGQVLRIPKVGNRSWIILELT